MTLCELVAYYASHHPFGLSITSVDQLLYSVHGWQNFAGRTLTVKSFCPPLFNPYIDWLRIHRSADTTRTRRGNLLTLWRYAFDEELTNIPPIRIRRLRRIERAPRAWTTEEVRRLLTVADYQPGYFPVTNLHRGRWFGSLTRTGYDTALRLGDLLALTPRQVADSRIEVVQHKTGRIVWCELRPETIASIARTLADNPDRDLVWPLWGRREAFFRAFRKIVLLSGVRPGSFKWLRRSAITACERVSPGSGTILAGHRSRATTEQWYTDRGQITETVLPPL